MKGIDVPIEILRIMFESKLWIGKKNNFYGRCFRNVTRGKLKPEIAITFNDYREVLLQDFSNSTVFFDVDPNRTILGNSDVESEVNIYFAVDLKALYPTLSRNEATETAYSDVSKIINASPFSINGIITGFESYELWDYYRDFIDDLSNYHLFRINTTIIYNLNC